MSQYAHFLNTRNLLCKNKNTIYKNKCCDILNTPKIEGDDINILKGYVFRMYPTKEQEELINKTKK